MKHLLSVESTGCLYNTHTKYYQKIFDYAKNLYQKTLYAHYGCVNALEFSNRESEHFASGSYNLANKTSWFGKVVRLSYLLTKIKGSDDQRILLWSVGNDALSARAVGTTTENYVSKPISLRSQHNSNIFTVAWDNENRRIFSGGNDHQVIVHDVKTCVHDVHKRQVRLVMKKKH